METKRDISQTFNSNVAFAYIAWCSYVRSGLASVDQTTWSGHLYFWQSPVTSREEFSQALAWSSRGHWAAVHFVTHPCICIGLLWVHWPNLCRSGEIKTHFRCLKFLKVQQPIVWEPVLVHPCSFSVSSTFALLFNLLVWIFNGEILYEVVVFFWYMLVFLPCIYCSHIVVQV